MEPKTRHLKRSLAVLAVALVVVVAGGTAALHRQRRADPLEGKAAKLSYAVGLELGSGARKQGIDLDPTLLASGLRDALAGGELRLTDEEARAALLDLQGELAAKRLASERALGERNQAEGERFLAENRSADGVVTLASGLQYRILEEGHGERPTDDEVVECSYRGTRIDGTEFDSSERRGRPAMLRVATLIPGFREALKLMPVGSRWQLFIPPALAYGAKAPRNLTQVGPNATLVYEVAVLAVRPTTSAPPAERAVEGRAARRPGR